MSSVLQAPAAGGSVHAGSRGSCVDTASLGAAAQSNGTNGGASHAGYMRRQPPTEGEQSFSEGLSEVCPVSAPSDLHACPWVPNT